MVNKLLKVLSHFTSFNSIFYCWSKYIYIFCIFQEEKKCFVCEKIPKEGSIYCSDDCITKHANKAIELLKKTKPKGQTDLKRPVLVTDPLSNAMLQGPSAPTEATLHSWLLSHPTFHVVLPKSSPSSKFYSTTTSKFYG